MPEFTRSDIEDIASRLIDEKLEACGINTSSADSRQAHRDLLAYLKNFKTTSENRQAQWNISTLLAIGSLVLGIAVAVISFIKTGSPH